MPCHMLGNIGQQFIVQRLIRGVAVFSSPNNGDVAVHAQHGYQKLFQIRPVVLAVTIGDFKRLFGQRIITIDADRSSIKMHLARIDPEALDGILR